MLKNVMKMRGPFSQKASGAFREMRDTHRLSRTLTHQGLNALALNHNHETQNDLIAALRMAYEGGFLPSAFNAVAKLLRENLEITNQHTNSAS